MANAAKIGNANSINALKWFDGLTDKFQAYSYFTRNLGTLSEMHEIIFGKKITKEDLYEYDVIERNRK